VIMMPPGSLREHLVLVPDLVDAVQALPVFEVLRRIHMGGVEDRDPYLSLTGFFEYLSASLSQKSAESRIASSIAGLSTETQSAGERDVGQLADGSPVQDDGMSPYGTSWHLMALPDRTKFSE
jgi:hypothetical protein